jgi:hypothetical protein
MTIDKRATALLGASLGFSLALLLTTSATVRAADENREPALKYRCEVGGKIFTISEGEPLKLAGVGADPTITIRPEPFREFPYGGVRFRYPSHFTFEADTADADTKHWTLSGNDFKIMYFVIQEDVSDEQYVGAMVGQFGEDKCTQSKTSITLNKQKYAGTRLRVSIAGNAMTMDVFRIGSGKETRLLVLQDNSDDTGKPSAEGGATLTALEKSFAAE